MNFKKALLKSLLLSMFCGLVLNFSSKQILVSANSTFIKPGDVLYFTPSPAWIGVDESNYRFAAYFFEQGIGDGNRGWFSLSAVSGKANLYTLTYGADRSWSNRVIFARMWGDNPTNDFATRRNQTQDLTIETVNKTHYDLSSITDGSFSGAEYGVDKWTNIYENEAIAFAQNFYNSVSAVCDPTGNNNNVTDTIWTNQTTAYNSLEPGSKTFFSGNPNNNSDIVGAKNIHNYIRNKYSRVLIF